jgi:hypothetical protein
MDHDVGGERLTRRFHGARDCGEVICPRRCRQEARKTGRQLLGRQPGRPEVASASGNPIWEAEYLLDGGNL